MSNTAQLPVEEPLPTATTNPGMLAWYRHIGIAPYSASGPEREAFLAGYRAARNPIHEEAL